MRTAEGLVELLEADVLGVLAEAATAHVEAVLADETVVVGADAAGARAGPELARTRPPDVLVTHVERCGVRFLSRGSTQPCADWRGVHAKL